MLFHAENLDVSDLVALMANFIFMVRDSKTGKTAETEHEKFLFDEAERRGSLRKRKIVDIKEFENGEVNRLEALLAEG
ncbi:hypothetical protein V6N13_118586 [Hibiscus sabdariffa]